MVTFTSGLAPEVSRLKLVRKPAVGMPVCDAYPTFPLTASWFDPKTEVASAKAVPRSAVLPTLDKTPTSPVDNRTKP